METERDPQISAYLAQVNQYAQGARDSLMASIAEAIEKLGHKSGPRGQVSGAPTGPRTPLTGRALRRAQGRTNKGMKVSLVSETHFNGKVVLAPSVRAPKRATPGRVR